MMASAEVGAGPHGAVYTKALSQKLNVVNVSITCFFRQSSTSPSAEFGSLAFLGPPARTGRDGGWRWRAPLHSCWPRSSLAPTARGYSDTTPHSTRRTRRTNPPASPALGKRACTARRLRRRRTACTTRTTRKLSSPRRPLPPRPRQRHRRPHRHTWHSATLDVHSQRVEATRWGRPSLMSLRQ